MRIHSAIVIVPVLALALAGCASEGAAVKADEMAVSQNAAKSSGTRAPAVVSPEAYAQAQAWLNAAVLPSGAVAADASVTTFSSFTSWPCGPVEELEGFWEVPGLTVSEATNWLRENPTGDLISTSVAPVPDDQEYDAATVGYIPEHDAQEGIVFTVQRMADGVAVRAEVAAQTPDALCPALPDGARYGAPGQG